MNNATTAIRGMIDIDGLEDVPWVIELTELTEEQRVTWKRLPPAMQEAVIDATNESITVTEKDEIDAKVEDIIIECKKDHFSNLLCFGDYQLKHFQDELNVIIASEEV